PLAALTPIAALAALALAPVLLRGTTAFLRRRGPALALGLLPQQRLARQLDAVVLVDGDHLHLDLVAELDHVLDLADVLVIQLADVTQTVAARRDLDEGPEILDRGDLTLVDAADADLLGDRLHLGPRRFGLGAVHVPDKHRAIVLDVDLRAGLLLNGLDRLAAGTDQQTDLFRIDLDGQQPRRVVGDAEARLAERAEHELEDLTPSLASLLQG